MSTKLRDLLKSFIVFNPEERKSAAELLKNPIFDSVRNEEQQVVSTKNVVLPLDEPGAYDYENFVDMIPLNKIQLEIESEIKKFNAFKAA